MPRTKQSARGRRRTRKSLAEEENDVSEQANDSLIATDQGDESLKSEQEDSQDVDQKAEESVADEGDASIISETTPTPEKAKNNTQKEEEEEQSTDKESNEKEEYGDSWEENMETDDYQGEGEVEQAEVHHPEGSTEEEDKKCEETEKKTNVHPDEIIPLYKPHSIPVFNNSDITEKWEWHIKIFPIDQADVRTCVLESVSKIAQETWLHIDKRNDGRGSFELCMRMCNDASMVLLKLLQAPMTYRYVTIQVNRRGKSKTEVARIEEVKALATSTEEDKEENTEKGKELDDEIAQLPFTEIEESATLLWDMTHASTIDKIKGKEKKRSLYVKYLPEGTSKELLNVLFPVANSLDIITTGKGRRVGELNVNCSSNVTGICQTYVATHINDYKNVTLDWKKANIDDGILQPEVTDDLPWEVVPRSLELPYEATPEMSEDEIILYRQRKRDRIEDDMRRGHSVDRMPGKRERKSRWDTGDAPPPPLPHPPPPLPHGPPAMGPDMLKMQMAMNDRIQSQLAFLNSVSGPGPRSIPSLMDAPVVGGRPGPERGRGDRPRDVPERPRKISESSHHSDDSRSGRDRSRLGGSRDRSSGRDSDRRDRFGGPPEFLGRGGRFEPPRGGGSGPRFGGGRGGSNGPFDAGRRGGRFGGPGRDFGERRGGRFGGNRFESPPQRGGRFGTGSGDRFGNSGGSFDRQSRGSHFGSQSTNESPRGGRTDGPGRGGFQANRGGRGRMDNSRGGRFDNQGSRGGGFDSHNRGGKTDPPSRGGFPDNRGRSGRFDNQSRGGRMDNQNRGRGFDNQGRNSYSNRGGGGGGNYRRGGLKDSNQQQQSFGRGQSYGNPQANYNYNQNTSATTNQGTYTNQGSYNNQQTSYAQQGSYGTQNTSMTSSQQTGYGTQQPTGYDAQQVQATYGNQQTTYVGQQQNAYTGYTQPQATSYTAPAAQATGYGTTTNTTEQGGYTAATTSAQQTGYTAESYWGQNYSAVAGQAAAYGAQAAVAGQQPDYSSQGYGQQQQTAQTTATAYPAATAYPGYDATAVANTAYTADPNAYANQAYYGATQGTTDASAYAAMYGVQDASAYGTAAQQTAATTATAYNFAQYPANPT